MFIPEITCSLTASNRLGRISFINLDYCLLLKNASGRLELSISVCSRGTKVEKMLTLAPERYTAGFCIVAKVILWCI